MEREGNKMIAEFMGYEYLGWNNPERRCVGETAGYWGLKNALVHHRKVTHTMLVKPLRYHSSWDCLMPALKKMKDFLQNMERPSKHHCCNGDLLEVDVQCAMYEMDIKKTYSAFLPLIEWYNNQLLTDTPHP